MMSKMKIEPQMESNIGAVFKNVTFEVTYEPADQGLPGRCMGQVGANSAGRWHSGASVDTLSLAVKQLVTGTVNLKDNFVPYLPLMLHISALE